MIRGTITAVQDHGSIISTYIAPDDPERRTIVTHWDRRQFDAFYEREGTAIMGMGVVVSYDDDHGPIITPEYIYDSDACISPGCDHEPAIVPNGWIDGICACCLLTHDHMALDDIELATLYRNLCP